MPAGCRWNTPHGGMFFWIELPAGVDAVALFPKAVAHGMAYVPGAAFYADQARANTLRLSFVTVSPYEITRGIQMLAQTLKEAA
jgi:2-aminoadipate transaminase